MKLKEALSKGKFVVTTEIQTPIGEEPERLLKNLGKVRGRVEGVSITEVEIEGVVGDTIQLCELLRQNRFEAIYQTATRLKNRPQLQKDLTQAYRVGVENLLVFTEDYRIMGDSLQEMMFFHVDVGKLSSVLEHIREGQTIEGQALPFKADFVLGSGVESAWGKDVPDLELREIEELTRIGAGYFLTTPVFDLARFEKFMGRVRPFGVPVIAEVIVLRTAGMARFLNRHFKVGLVPDRVIQNLARAADKQLASLELFAELIAGLKELCQGVHIITIGGEDKLARYLDVAKLR